MTVDIAAARRFMTTHARLLDRHRLDLLLGEGRAESARGALSGYANADGGYGWGLEPDLRSPESQPGAALHAFEVFADVAPVTVPAAVELCDWLLSVTLPDGGLPFALPLTAPDDGTASWWASADPTVSSLQITAIVAARAHEVGAHDPAVAAHPWLAGATAYCARAVADRGEGFEAMERAFAVQLFDVVPAEHPGVRAALETLGRGVPDDGVLPVVGGVEGEALHATDLAPYPDRPARGLLAAAAVDADLQRLADGQQPDGGWLVDFAAQSPAAALEWRGHQTVRVLAVLMRNGLLRG